MNVVLAVTILALFDAMLSGFRAAAGRDGRIDKRTYVRRAVGRGLVFGTVVIGANALFVAVLVATADDPQAAWRTFVDAGRTIVLVFAGFAAATTAAVAFWLSPVAETRVLATVIVLGPLTLIRPWVIAAGLAVAVLGTGDPRVAVAAMTAGGSMLALEHWLGRAYADAWRGLR